MTTAKTKWTRRCALLAAAALVAALIVATTFAQAGDGATPAIHTNDTADAVQVVEFPSPLVLESPATVEEQSAESNNCIGDCATGDVAPPPPPQCPCTRRRFFGKHLNHYHNASDADACCASRRFERQRRERHGGRKHVKAASSFLFNESAVKKSKKMWKKHGGAAGFQGKLSRDNVRRHAVNERRGERHNRTACVVGA